MFGKVAIEKILCARTVDIYCLVVKQFECKFLEPVCVIS